MSTSLIIGAANLRITPILESYQGMDSLIRSFVAGSGWQSRWEEVKNLLLYVASFGVYEEEMDSAEEYLQDEVKRAIHNIAVNASKDFTIMRLRDRSFLFVAPYQVESRIYQAVMHSGIQRAWGELEKTASGDFKSRVKRVGAGGAGTLTVHCDPDQFHRFVRPMLETLTDKHIVLGGR
ncbi:hypothetical protein [Streptomyces sp. NPDC051014]|uniref:hypothetical protein n=1 Tax=Streptomyces sp. NPDC051014 TaxID=3155751 RepID=UPI0033CA9740